MLGSQDCQSHQGTRNHPEGWVDHSCLEIGRFLGGRRRLRRKHTYSLSTKTVQSAGGEPTQGERRGSGAGRGSSECDQARLPTGSFPSEY